MKESIIKKAQAVIATEIESVEDMSSKLNQQFVKAVDIILSTKGRVVVVGMGKSGIIGQKLAATMASTGTPSFFVHPGEAFHGDLGMIKPIDVALLISNSGETEEVIRLLPFLEYQGNKVVAMTGNVNSTLGKHADVILDIGVEKEACDNNLAPTSSTTCTLVMGDALAIVLSKLKNFQPEDFARFHPGGSLGRRLLTKVSDVMRKKRLPICSTKTVFKDIVLTINKGHMGLALVIDDGVLKGIVTDGDLRRIFARENDFSNLIASEIMTPNPKTILPNVRFSDAESFMKSEQIGALVVINSQEKVVGILQIYDLE